VKSGYIKVVLPTGAAAQPDLAGVNGQRIHDALATHNNAGVEDNVPQGGVVWLFAVKKRSVGIAPARY
jgi:hypothetical protein